MTSPLASSTRGVPAHHGLGDQLILEDNNGGEGWRLSAAPGGVVTAAGGDCWEVLLEVMHERGRIRDAPQGRKGDKIESTGALIEEGEMVVVLGEEQ
jgi:hypothetical protein